MDIDHHRVAIRSRSVELPHRDPAYRAATAVIFGLTLVTDDERLLTGRSWAVLSNRR